MEQQGAAVGLGLKGSNELAEGLPMTFLYFAYGSNMLPARLQRRCSSARFVGCGEAAGWDLEFSKVSNDESGKATMFSSDDALTPGALFEIADSDLDALDTVEGAGAGYDRDDHFGVAIAGTNQPVMAKTYLASAIDRRLKPYDWYLALVIAGASFHAFSEGYLTRLQGIDHLTDAQSDRRTRLDALAALQVHGFTNYQTLLRVT